MDINNPQPRDKDEDGDLEGGGGVRDGVFLLEGVGRDSWGEEEGVLLVGEGRDGFGEEGGVLLIGECRDDWGEEDFEVLSTRHVWDHYRFKCYKCQNNIQYGK